MSILQILDNIGSDTKRSHKLAIVEKNKDNELFMSVLNLALNPYVKFYIKAIPNYNAGGSNSLEWAITELKRLSTRQLTGNAGVEHLRNILTNVSEDDAIVIERIIGKDLRMGCSEGIVNAVAPKFIPSYPCLLARPYDAKNIKNIVYPAISNLKADGARTNFHVNGDSVYVCGRSGREFNLFGAMSAEFIELGKQFDVPVVFDGELVVVDKNGHIVDRRVGNGIVNKAVAGTISPEEASMLRAQLWDVIPLSEFQEGKSKLDYKARFELLKDAIIATEPIGEDLTAQLLKTGTKSIYWLIPHKIVNNLQEAVDHFNELLAAGEEGTILKNFSNIWSDTRSKDLVKMKAERSCDLEIIGFKEGTGKFLGQVGSLECASSDRLVEASVSGFSDAVRLDITNRFDELKGTIVEVLYNERIGSKGRTNIDSLFLPRVKSFRHPDDKSIADSTREIL